jgi:hypothetical protein
MTLSARTGVLWIAANIAAFVVMPLIMWRWIAGEVSASDATLPEGFAPSTLVLAFTLAWAVFLLLLNTAVALFLWLRAKKA